MAELTMQDLRDRLEAAQKDATAQRLAWHNLAGKTARLCDAVDATIQHLRGESNDVRDALNVGITLAATAAVVRKEIEA